MGYADKNFDSNGKIQLKKFSSGQVTHHGAKFAVFFDVPTTPINSITIDEHGVTLVGLSPLETKMATVKPNLNFRSLLIR
jgi:hypothetical protein